MTKNRKVNDESRQWAPKSLTSWIIHKIRPSKTQFKFWLAEIEKCPTAYLSFQYIHFKIQTGFSIRYSLNFGIILQRNSKSAENYPFSLKPDWFDSTDYPRPIRFVIRSSFKFSYCARGKCILEPDRVANYYEKFKSLFVVNAQVPFKKSDDSLKHFSSLSNF